MCWGTRGTEHGGNLGVSGSTGMSVATGEHMCYVIWRIIMQRRCLVVELDESVAADRLRLLDLPYLLAHAEESVQ